MFNKSFILLFIILFVNLVLGFSVLFKNLKERAGRYFFAFTLFSSFWMLVSFLEDEIKRAAVLNILLRLDYSSGIFIAISFLGLCLSTTGNRLLDKKNGVFVLWIVPLFFSVLIIFTNAIVAGFSILPNGFDPIFGRYELVYEALVILLPLLGFFVLAQKYRKVGEEEKLKIIYILLGFLLFFVTIILTNVVLVDIIKNSPNFVIYSRLGIYSIVFVTVFASYSIIKHRLFNIKIIATELLSFAILIVSFVQIFTANSVSDLIIRVSSFVVLFILVASLVRSVDNEVKRKEELQTLSDQLAEANTKLRQLDKAKSEFISIASHQLRTPLTSIKGFGSLLLEGTYGVVPETQRNALEKIYVSNERLIQLVEDLLNISRIEAGRMEFDFQEAQIEDLIDEAVQTLELSAKAKNLYLHWQKPEILMPKVKIDITKIKEVISNMVDNAIKYTQKGGITVRLEKNTAWDSEHKEHKSNISVIVSDTGIGMDEEEIEMIFEKFQRGKEVAHYHTDGTGLGMYIGKKIVAEHKGRIWAESDGKGKGSRFILELPVC